MRSSHLFVAALVALAASTANAQERFEKPKPPHARATTKPADAPPQSQGAQGNATQGNTPLGGSVSAFITPDGRVLANFGYGYEVVSSYCSASGTSAGGNGTPNSQGLPSVPDQQTESARNLPSARAQQQKAEAQRQNGARGCIAREGDRLYVLRY